MVHMCAAIFGNELVGKRSPRFDGRLCDKWHTIHANRCMDSMTMDRCALCHLVRRLMRIFSPCVIRMMGPGARSLYIMALTTVPGCTSHCPSVQVTSKTLVSPSIEDGISTPQKSLSFPALARKVLTPASIIESISSLLIACAAVVACGVLSIPGIVPIPSPGLVGVVCADALLPVSPAPNPRPVSPANLRKPRRFHEILPILISPKGTIGSPTSLYVTTLSELPSPTQ